MIVIGVLVRPRQLLTDLATKPRLRIGFVAVLLSAIVSALIELAGAAAGGGGGVDVAIPLVLPVLFLAYWLASALVIDAGAGLFGAVHRWRAYLAVSGVTFVPWVAYAVLSLVESGATHLGSGGIVASALSWLTLPLLVWFLALTALAVRAVYDVTLFSAAALAMLPDAVLAAALIAILLVADVLHTTGVI